jgi:hypothetical protein
VHVTAHCIIVGNPKKKKSYLFLFGSEALCVTRKLHAEMTTMPSSCPGSPEPLEPGFTAPILARLLVHVPVQGTAKKKSSRKETRTKEFTHCFEATKRNYIQLLNAILEKHHIGTKYHATERRHYGCKMQVPPAK